MSKRLLNSKKLEELVSANKADNSITKSIKDNDDEYTVAKKELRKITRKIEKHKQDINSKKQELHSLSNFSVKGFINDFKYINELKKQLKKLQDEKTYFEDICSEKLALNTEIEENIDIQYTIYQENELYIKAVEKIDQKGIDLSGDFYSRYLKHVNSYMNSMYSIKNNTKLKAPDSADLAFLLGVLQKSEKTEKKDVRKKSVKSETESKKATKSVAKKDDSIVDDATVVEVKKNSRRRATVNQ